MGDGVGGQRALVVGGEGAGGEQRQPFGEDAGVFGQGGMDAVAQRLDGTDVARCHGAPGSGRCGGDGRGGKPENGGHDESVTFPAARG